MKQTMCVVRKYVVKRPEIEERERERETSIICLFLGFSNNKTGIFTTEKKNYHTKKKGKHPSPDKNKGLK